MFDIFCFGLSLLEMILISSDITGPHTFKQLCKIINKGEKDEILRNIIDEKMRDFITKALEDDPEKRATLEELLQHPFLLKGENDHHEVKLSGELAQLISKYQMARRQQQRTTA